MYQNTSFVFQEKNCVKNCTFPSQIHSKPTLLYSNSTTNRPFQLSVLILRYSLSYERF